MMTEEVIPVRTRTRPVKKSWNDRWGSAHNDRRREQYESDPEYRENWLDTSRRNYRERNGVVLESCLDRVDMLGAYGAERTVVLNGVTSLNRLCFTMGELAAIVGDHKAPVVYRWRSRELIPEPIADANVWQETSGRGGHYFQWQQVYLSEEVDAMVRVIGEHQQRLRYYRSRDVETIARVFAAVDAARSRL